ncbi:hypothetical protein [Pelosinus propionicus]|uniref:Uncharacterized protein n=1 Tax=Pelosinus propionicus DSM 13327 TaxID=1123291 RepID=A0A1I4QGE0_9FIRM|nr:hypothetical protein [Pelosinus propionicus]SFM39182.1 hypothetical protein SAMN04490355_11001 [Pelosinus propionicus DSM 13327]
MIDRINFEPSDYRYDHLEPTAEEIANFLIKFQSKFSTFCEFLRLSAKWEKASYRNELNKWQAAIKGRRKPVAFDTQLFSDLIEAFFGVCLNDNDIKKMRGLVPEKLLNKIFQDRHNGKEIKDGYGCIVAIDGRRIEYICASPFNDREDSDLNRKTVDVGTWDGNKAEFLEVKVSPMGFHTKDIKYLNLLAQEMKKVELGYDVYLVALDDKELTRSRLNCLSDYVENSFSLIGREEIFSLREAI